MSNIRKIILIVAVTIFFGLQFPLHRIILEKRKESGFVDRIIYKPADIINMSVLAGFKGVAADILWIRIDDYSHAGQLYKLLPIFEMVTYLQPHFILAWSLGGWHMSFNLYHEAGTQEQKKRWLTMGINFTKRGIKYNPQDYRLYFDVGWIHWMKTKKYKKCIEYFSLASNVDHPQWVEHMLAHAYEKNGQLEKAYEIWLKIKKRGSTPGLAGVVDKFYNRLFDKLKKKSK